MEWAELQELEKMVGKLTFTALKLSPGVERRDSLNIIGGFRERIDAMKWAEVARSLCQKPLHLVHDLKSLGLLQPAMSA